MIKLNEKYKIAAKYKWDVFYFDDDAYIPIEQASKTVAQLEDDIKMRGYVKHSPDCWKTIKNRGCTCGLIALLTDTQEVDDER